MTKLYYIANIRLPTEKAHGIQIMKMCEAFADQGYSVELVLPNRKTHITEDPFSYYNVRKNFEIKRLWCLDTVKYGWLGFWIESVTFAESIFLYGLKKSGIFYTRDELNAVFLASMGKRTIWEAHMGQTNFLVRLLLRLKIPLVVITRGLKDLYLRHGADDALIHISPDGVDIEQFDIPESKSEARKKVGFAEEDKIVLYTGHLYSWKGADSLALSASLIDKSIKVVFVGGTEKDLQTFKGKYGHIDNVIILGKKPHHEMPLYMRSADLLMIPNSAKEDISKLYTSPMKLFEYMASGTPILASDLPSLREVLDESNSYFFSADDEKSLSDSISSIFNNYREAQDKATVARKEVEGYSWKKRAEKIIEFIK